MNKQIEEIKAMADVVEHILHKNHREASQFLIADSLYNAGYRKQTEVADEIFAEIERLCIDTLGNFNHRVFAELKKKYTKGGEV